MANKTEIEKTPKEKVPALAQTVEVTQVQQMIHLIRGERVILDRDLAILYGVTVSYLNRQVKRNIERFPEDFMFQLTNQELTILKCQNGISSWGGDRHLPYAFTEEGVAMLSGLLRSPVAIQMNVQIMRAFVYMKNTLATLDKAAVRQGQLELEIEKLRNYIEDILRDQNDINDNVSAQMDAISQSLAELSSQVDDLAHPKRKPHNPIGYEAIDAQRKAKNGSSEKRTKPERG